MFTGPAASLPFPAGEATWGLEQGARQSPFLAAGHISARFSAQAPAPLRAPASPWVRAGLRSGTCFQAPNLSLVALGH